jgi:hypothetical protein
VPPNNFSSFVSLAYVPSNTVADTYDVIAVDQGPSATTIWRFLGPSYTVVRQVWTCTSLPCPGPQQAFKVAVDGDGTLYVLSSDRLPQASGNTVELWAFVKVLSATNGFAASPVLVDAYVAGYGPNGGGRRDYSVNNIHGEPVAEYPTLPNMDSRITLYSPGEGSIGYCYLGQFCTNPTGNSPNAFDAAVNGPHASVVSNNPAWIRSLSADPLAKWIAVDPLQSPQSALYAYSFKIASPSIDTASLTLNFAVDNNLGELANVTGPPSSYSVPGLYLNRSPINGGGFLDNNAVTSTSGMPPTTSRQYDAFAHEHRYTNPDIHSLLANGANTLYLYQYDFGVVAGLIFSGTITVNANGSSETITLRSGNSPTWDLIVAPAGVAGPLNAGDVLVMFGDAADGISNKAVIADYSASQLQIFVKTGHSQCPQGLSTCTGVNPLTVLNSEDLRFSPGEAARSLAVWPVDSHVMIMTSTPDPLSQTTNAFPIHKFTWNIASNSYIVQQDSDFASNIAGFCLPVGTLCGPTTLRTGVLSGTSYAFVTAPAQASSGSNLVAGPSQLLELTQTNGLNVKASLQESDGALTGLAVQATGTGTAAGCISGCAITVGDNHTITGTTTAINAINALPANRATITETVCNVPHDPRRICGGTDTTHAQYNATELPVKSVCPDSPSHPSFGNTKIPDYICGSYGTFGNGFVLILGKAEGVDAIPGLFIKNDVDPTRFFASSSPPSCPQSGTPPFSGNQFVPDVFGWAPWTGSTVEGFIPEGLNMTELTWGCGGGTGHSSGLSLTMIGGRLDLTHATRELGPNPTVNSFLKFANYKYVNLGAEVLFGNISTPQKIRLGQLIVSSLRFLNAGIPDCAANKLWSTDKYVSDNGVSFFGAPGIDPNPYGRIRARLANLLYVVFSEIEGRPPPVTWPLPAAPGACSVYLDPDGY